MSFLTPKVPEMPKPEPIPQQNDQTVQAAKLKQFADEQNSGANAITNRLGAKTSFSKLGDASPFDQSSTVLTGRG